MNEDLIRQFYDENVVPLIEGEVYLMVGGARKKYAMSNTDLSRSYEVVSRKLIRDNDKRKFITNIKKIKGDLSLSRDSKTDKFFPEESFTIWFNPNPRSSLKAYVAFQKKMNHHLVQLTNMNSKGREDHYRQFNKQSIHLHSEFQKNASRKFYSIVDIDTKDEKILIRYVKLLYSHIAWVSETRGGYHIVYRVEGNKLFFRSNPPFFQIDKDEGKVEIQHDRLTYVWGVIQGGFMVKPVDWNDLIKY